MEEGRGSSCRLEEEEGKGSNSRLEESKGSSPRLKDDRASSPRLKEAMTCSSRQEVLTCRLEASSLARLRRAQFSEARSNSVLSSPGLREEQGRWAQCTIEGTRNYGWRKWRWGWREWLMWMPSKCRH